MTTVMSLQSTADRSEWQYARMPRLAYRNPLPPAEDSLQTESTPTSPITPTANTPGRSIAEIRKATIQSQSLSAEPQQPQSTVPPTQAQKIKRSLFGSLFQKEPTLSAFEQYGQSMIAQHGSLSPKDLPNVSAKTMPSDVPKVNSKWDGVPDYVKMREEEEREKAKGRNRKSKLGIPGLQSGDSYEDNLPTRRRNSNATSVTESWDSYSTGSRPYFSEGLAIRPESIYSTSSGGSTPSAGRPTWEKTYSYTSSSASKLSDNSTQPYKDAASTPRGPHRLQSSQSVSTQYSNYSDQSRLDASPSIMATTVDAIPEHTSSPAATPVERSPQTPSPFSEDENGLDGLLRGETIPPLTTTVRTGSKQTPNRPGAEARSSTSKRATRAGLGLRTNSDVAPWETQAPPSATSTASQSTLSPTSPRGKLRIFGRDKK